MRRAFVLPLTLVVTILLLLVVAIHHFVRADNFRPEIEAEATAILGRKVQLGEIHLYLISSKIVADDVEVADDPAFSNGNILTAQSLEIGVKLWPLITSRQLIITGIELDQPEIRLLNDGAGRWNFDSLGKASTTSAGTNNFKPQALSVDQLRVTNGTIITSTMNDPRDTRVYDHFNLDVTDFSALTQSPFTLVTNLPGGGSATLDGKAGPIDFVSASSTPLNAVLHATGINIAAYRLVNPATGIDGIVTLDETLKFDAKMATIAGTFTGSNMKLAPKGVPSSKIISIQHEITIDIDHRLGTIQRADILVGNAKLHASGTYEDGVQARVLNIHVTGQNAAIDELKALLPAMDVKLPTGSHLQGGSVSTDLHLKGTTGSWIISGPVQIANTRLAGFNLGEHIGSLAGLDGKAASLPDTSIRSLSLNLELTTTGAHAKDIRADIPSVGIATGAGTVSPKSELNIATTVVPTGGMAGGLTKAASAGGGKPGTVPVQITGTIEKPVFTADTGAAARGIAAQAAKGIVSVPIHAIGKVFGKKQ